MAQVNLGHVVGPGVPTGGTANQILVKNGATNFDTSWKDAGSIPSIANVQDGLAIVANGNTHAAITSGQYVYVKNHGTLADGLYKATAAIGTNAALSTSNLTADSQGGLNDLKGQVDSLNSNITTVYDTSSSLSGLQNGVNSIKINAGTTIGSYTLSNNMRGFAIKDGTTCIGFLATYNGDSFIVVGNNSLNHWVFAKSLTS